MCVIITYHPITQWICFFMSYSWMWFSVSFDIDVCVSQCCGDVSAPSWSSCICWMSRRVSWFWFPLELALWSRYSQIALVFFVLSVQILSGHNGHTHTALVFVYLKVFVLVLFQVWKVKKAFKIHVIWRGLTPTFLVNLYCFFSLVLWIKVNTDYSLTVNCSWSILQFGKLDESEKRTEHYDTLVRTSFIQNSAVWLCFDISEYRSCYISILFLRAGDEVSVLSAVSSVCRRGGLRSRVCQVQKVTSHMNIFMAWFAENVISGV